MKTFLNILTAAMIFIAALTLPSQADSTLTVNASATALRDQSFRVNSVDGVHGVPLAKFTATSNGGDTSIARIQVGISQNAGNPSANATPSTIYVYDGATVVGSAAVNTSQPYINVGVSLASGSPHEFTLKGDFPTTTSGWVQVQILNVRSVSSEGIQTDKLIEWAIDVPIQRFFPSITEWSLASPPTIQTVVSGNGTPQSLIATFTLNAMAVGADMKMPENNDFTVVVRTGPYDEAECPIISVVTIPNNNIADGSVATVTVTALIPESQILKPGHYSMAIRQINWGKTTTGAVQIEQNWGLKDFKTPSIYFAKVAPLIPYRLTEISGGLYAVIGNISYGGEYGTREHVVVGEGHSVEYVPGETNPIHQFVFPYDCEDKGERMQVDPSIGNLAMDPIVKASPNLGTNSSDPWIQYSVSNVQKVIDGYGKVTKVYFDVVLGSFTAHGNMTRTGPTSCRIKFFWGTGSTSTHPGNAIDLLNLSPGTEIAYKGYPAGPLRFKFEQKEIVRGGGVVSLPITALQDSFNMQGSNDLVHWVNMGWAYSANPSSMDATGSVRGEVKVYDYQLDDAGLSKTKCFFRAVLNQ